MRNEKLYRQAIEIASYAEERFLEAHEKNRAVSPAAAEACAQQSLIAELFGVSEKKVHQDLASAILAR